MTWTIFLSNFKRNGVRHFYFFYLLHQFSFLVEFDVFGGFFAFSSSIRHCAVLFCAKFVGIPLAYDCWDWLLFAAIKFRDTYYTPLGWPIQTRKRDIKRNKSKANQTKSGHKHATHTVHLLRDHIHIFIRMTDMVQHEMNPYLLCPRTWHIQRQKVHS